MRATLKISFCEKTFKKVRYGNWTQKRYCTKSPGHRGKCGWRKGIQSHNC